METGAERMPTYHELVIVASSPDTKIWLAHDEGHLVQAVVHTLSTRLLPGAYVVEFGLGTTTYPLRLDAASHYSQAEIEAGPVCPRPVPQLPSAGAP